MTFDAVVVGLGASGSAALYQLARRGQQVLGIEQFSPGHDRGSSHGHTRIIRFGYFEHPSYVPLARLAHGMWREIEKAARRPLLTTTGILEIGRPDSGLVAGTLASSRQHDLPHEVLDAERLMRRYPAFRLPQDFIGVLQPDAGVLEVEPAIHAQLELAKAHGAQIRSNSRVTTIEPRGSGVRIVTAEGDVFDAASAIVAAGPWLAKLLPDSRLPLRVTRQAVLWVTPEDPEIFAPGRFPIFMIESANGIHYGFPLHGDDGLKIAKHHHVEQAADPDDHARIVSEEDENIIRETIREFLPAADAPRKTASTCLYTMTPDGDFIIDRLPGSPQIIIASPCSGHGFKFAPAIGAILADLTRGETSHDISRFALRRFL